MTKQFTWASDRQYKPALLQPLPAIASRKDLLKRLFSHCAAEIKHFPGRVIDNIEGHIGFCIQFSAAFNRSLRLFFGLPNDSLASEKAWNLLMSKQLEFFSQFITYARTRCDAQETWPLWVSNPDAIWHSLLEHETDSYLPHLKMPQPHIYWRMSHRFSLVGFVDGLALISSCFVYHSSCLYNRYRLQILSSHTKSSSKKCFCKKIWCLNNWKCCVSLPHIFKRGRKTAYPVKAAMVHGKSAAK